MQFAKLITVLACAMFSWSAMAQETTTETTTTETTTQVEQQEEAQEVTPPTKNNMEKVEVTGSHIKRINVEGPSPVLVLDREYLQRSGYNSVADVLRDSTLTANGVGRETSGSSVSGSATTGLRGFGADKILVLMNGNRLPKIGGGNSVDLNLIPFQAIEKVEILKDGASATYGSDALAGVINFITKKDYDGATFMMRSSLTAEEGGDRDDIAALWGKNFSKGNIMAIYQYRSNKEILDSQRPWSQGGSSPFGSPGSFRPSDDTNGDTDDWQADPRCPAGQQVNFFGNGPFCSFDFSPYSWSIPAIEQHSAVLTGAYEMNESISMFTDLLYTRRMSRWQFAPAPGFFQDERNPDGSGNNFQIPASTANQWGINNGGEPVDVAYRFVDELGPRSNRDTTDSYGGTIGVRGYMMDSWEWEQNLTYGKSEIYNRGHSGYANTQTIVDLMNATPTTQFNPFSAAVQDVSSARHVSEQWIDSQLIMTQFRMNGELGQLLGGLTSAAFGVSGAWEDYEERVDAVTAAGNLFGGAAGQGIGSRSYQALFAELGWATKQVELQLSGRFDRYSDFGETVNPKLALRYTPINSLMFRSSIGTGFKAPTLEELYAAQGYGFPDYVDVRACNAAGGDASLPVCQPQQYRTLQGGNPNLKEETSLSYNFGTLFQATRDMSFTLDWWHTEINDAIGIDLDGLMLADSLNIALPAGVAVNRDNSGNLIGVDAPLVNTAKQEAEGIDFSFDYMFKIGGITLRPHMDHSHYLIFKTQPIPGLPVQDQLDWAGRPRWRNTSYITVGFLQDHSVRFTGRTIAGQFKEAHNTNQADQRRTSTYTEYDLDYRWSTSWNGIFTVGVKNLLNSDRPLDDTANFADRLNTSLYDQIGQLYYLGYTQSF
ncbi:MAG: TonB-dependent receptor [Bdellovibrionales bacterium]|nr:TonB-dependent receptor [Bdellovibrionales bacterium]NQZ18825.1 TonB-dependent receptor [Bdellovibrionales bacterium]